MLAVKAQGPEFKSSAPTEKWDADVTVELGGEEANGSLELNGQPA